MQVLLSVLGIVGGSTGLAAIATVMVQRGRFKADAADTLTDAALTLVQPLQTRITELEGKALSARAELSAPGRCGLPLAKRPEAGANLF